MIQRDKGVLTYPSGRQVCDKTKAGKAVYRGRVYMMWLRQRRLCCICRTALDFADAVFEHQDGRGMNGSHRDDRIEKDGKPYNGAAHSWCNVQKGSRRIDYNSTATLRR